MAETGQFADTFQGIFGNVLNVSVLVVIGFLVLALVGSLIYYFFFYRKKFNIDVKIISLRASDPYIILDKAALLYDSKNKVNYMKLWDQKKEFNMPPFRILQTSNKGDYLELYRKSENEFCFLTKPKVDSEWIVRLDGKKYPMAKLKSRQIEADYYWLMKRQQEDKSWISPDTIWSKLIQMAPIIIPGVLMLILFMFLLNALPTIFSGIAEILDRLNSLEGVVSKG